MIAGDFNSLQSFRLANQNEAFNNYFRTLDAQRAAQAQDEGAYQNDVAAQMAMENQNRLADRNRIADYFAMADISRKEKDARTNERLASRQLDIQEKGINEKNTNDDEKASRALYRSLHNDIISGAIPDVKTLTGLAGPDIKPADLQSLKDLWTANEASRNAAYFNQAKGLESEFESTTKPPVRTFSDKDFIDRYQGLTGFNPADDPGYTPETARSIAASPMMKTSVLAMTSPLAAATYKAGSGLWNYFHDDRSKALHEIDANEGDTRQKEAIAFKDFADKRIGKLPLVADPSTLQFNANEPAMNAYFRAQRAATPTAPSQVERVPFRDGTILRSKTNPNERFQVINGQLVPLPPTAVEQ